MPGGNLTKVTDGQAATIKVQYGILVSTTSQLSYPNIARGNNYNQMMNCTGKCHGYIWYYPLQ